MTRPYQIKPTGKESSRMIHSNVVGLEIQKEDFLR